MALTTMPTKKCPECFTYLPGDAKVCHSCNIKVGEAGKEGVAKKPVDWMSYFVSIVAIVILGLFVWWSFFRSK